MTSNYIHHFDSTNSNNIQNKNHNQESILSFSSIKIKDSQTYDTNTKRNKSIDPLINSANLLNSNSPKISIDNLITQSQR